MLKGLFSKSKNKDGSGIASMNVTAERMKDAELLEKQRLAIVRDLEDAMAEYAKVTGYKNLKVRKHRVGVAPNDYRER